MDGSIFELQQRNAVVFKEVYDEYHSRLYFFILKHTQSPFLAEETVQLTFIKLWERADRLSDQFDISVQLFRIAKSIMIDLMRKENTRLHHSSKIFSGISVVSEINDVENRQELLRVQKAIENMAPVRKAVFTLCRLQGYSHLKIAQHLSISTKTVENHIAKAMKQLRRTLTCFLL